MAHLENIPDVLLVNVYLFLEISSLKQVIRIAKRFSNNSVQRLHFRVQSQAIQKETQEAMKKLTDTWLFGGCDDHIQLERRHAGMIGIWGIMAVCQGKKKKKKPNRVVLRQKRSRKRRK